MLGRRRALAFLRGDDRRKGSMLRQGVGPCKRNLEGI